MVEFAQSVPNLTEASSNLYELIKGRDLSVYSDADIRLAISRCVAIETSRGWRIAKEKASHKIDVVVALAMAALGAVEQKPDPVEQMEAWYRSVAERQREEDEAARRGKKPPPRDNPVSQAYVRGCERWRKIAEEIQEWEEGPNGGRILPSLVTYGPPATRK